MNTDFEFENLFDPKKIAEIIARDKNKLAAKIRDKVRNKIISLSPSTCISFELRNSNNDFIRDVDLKASREYALTLIAFMKGSTHDGYRVESQVSYHVLNAAEEAITEFYSDPEIQDAVSAEITRQLKESKIIQVALEADISQNHEWLKHEFSTLLAGNAGYSIAGQSIDAMASSMAHFFSSAVGKSILMSMGKIMATQMGHILIRYIATAVSKALASTAFRSAVVAAIKKIGIAVLVKTIVGKAILALLAMVGISGIPVLWIILPLIAGVLYYEYTKFPGKLAEKLPENIADGIITNFNELNKDVSENIVKSVAKEIIDEITKIRKDKE